MSLAFGPVSRFMTRSLYSVLESRHSMHAVNPFSFPQRLKPSLRFWSANLEGYSAWPIWHSPSAVRVVYSDASETRYGGYVVQHEPCVLHGQWSAEEAAHSSTWHEFSAVCLVLLSVAHKLVNAQVCWLQITRMLCAFFTSW